MSKPRIVVGICTGGTVRAEMMLSLISNIYGLGADGIQLGILAQMGGYVAVNRNSLVGAAFEQDATHLMFIDSDMIFPDDGIAKLISHDKDIVGANYNVRMDPKSIDGTGPTVKMFNRDRSPKSIRTKDLPKKLFKCYGLATGFMLIKTDVFKKLEMPYFETYQDKQGTHHTEDIEFCRRAQEVGIEVYCDPTIEMGHIGSCVY